MEAGEGPALPGEGQVYDPDFADILLNVDSVGDHVVKHGLMRQRGMYRFLLISGDKDLTARIKLALESVSTVMSADPAIDNVEELAAQFRPEGILVDSDIRMGARTAFERLAIVREWFPALPMIVIGNESGVQLILTAMRAGAQDFIDRDAAEDGIRDAAIRHTVRLGRQAVNWGESLCPRRCLCLSSARRIGAGAPRRGAEGSFPAAKLDLRER